MDLEEMEVKVRSLTKQYENLLLSCTQLNESVKQFSTSMLDKIHIDHLDAHKEEVNASIDQVHEKISDCNSYIDILNYDVKSIKSDMHSKSKSIEDHDKKHLSHEEDIKKLTDSIGRSRHDLDTNMHFNVSSLKRDLTEKIDALVIPKDVVTMDQVKKQISEQIEPAIADAKRSYLTSKQFELRINLLEKRMENVRLKLKISELEYTIEKGSQ